MSSKFQAAIALREAITSVAAAEHKYLKESQAHDGFELLEIESSDVTDDDFTVFFDLKIDGKVMSFAYSLGYDGDVDAYSPYAEVCGGTEETPDQHQFRVKSFGEVGESGQSQQDVLDSIEQLGRECGEIRFSVFKWLESLQEKSSEHQTA